MDTQVTSCDGFISSVASSRQSTPWELSLSLYSFNRWMSTIVSLYAIYCYDKSTDSVTPSINIDVISIRKYIYVETVEFHHD